MDSIASCSPGLELAVPLPLAAGPGRGVSRMLDAFSHLQAWGAIPAHELVQGGPSPLLGSPGPSLKGRRTVLSITVINTRAPQDS